MSRHVHIVGGNVSQIQKEEKNKVDGMCSDRRRNDDHQMMKCFRYGSHTHQQPICIT